MQKKGGGDDHWLDDDEEGGDDENDGYEDDEDAGRDVAMKMDGWDDEDDDDSDGEVDAESPAHFIRQISKDDPFFGKSDEKPKNGNGKSKPPTSPSAVDLDPERLAAAFDATPSADEYEKVEDPLGLALARSATMSSSEMLSGSEGKKKKKEKKAKKEKKEKKGEKSASKSKSGKSMRDWDESD